jgi:N-acetyl-gamma-glutamylphosphate reductase
MIYVSLPYTDGGLVETSANRIALIGIDELLAGTADQCVRDLEFMYDMLETDSRQIE